MSLTVAIFMKELASGKLEGRKGTSRASSARPSRTKLCFITSQTYRSFRKNEIDNCRVSQATRLCDFTVSLLKTRAFQRGLHGSPKNIFSV